MMKKVNTAATTGSVNSVGPGPGAYNVSSAKKSTTGSKLGKFSKQSRKSPFDKKNQFTYNFKKMKKKRLNEL